MIQHQYEEFGLTPTKAIDFKVLSLSLLSLITVFVKIICNNIKDCRRNLKRLSIYKFITKRGIV